MLPIKGLVFQQNGPVGKVALDLNQHAAIARLDNLAMRSAGIWTQIDGTCEGEPFKCLVQCHDYYDTNTKSNGIIIHSNKHGLFAGSDSIASAMVHAAQVLKGSVIDWDSIWIKSSKCPVKRKELVQLVTEAWHEVFPHA